MAVRNISRNNGSLKMMRYIDCAITRREDDVLDRAEFVETLARALIEDIPAAGNAPRSIRSKGNVIGLTGEWGCGKSSVLNLLAEYLGSRSKTIVVQFNPWMFQSHLDLLDGFFNELTFQLGKSPLDELRELVGLVDQYRDSLAAGGSLLSTVSPTLRSGWSIALSLVPRARKRSAQDARKSVEQKISASGLAIVVLIDELDRVEDEEVRSVARLIKAVGDIRGISYLVAYDPKRVIDALGRGSGKDRRASGEAYIEKIVQLAVPIRPLMDYEVLKMLRESLKTQGYGAQQLEQQEAALQDLAASLNTPRDIKRTVANFSAIEPMVRGEIDSMDVLFYSYLLVKAPLIRDFIANNLDAVVDDPSEAYQLQLFQQSYERKEAGKDASPSIQEVFGDGAKMHEGVLKYLFPTFNKKRESGFYRDRICKRRNLLRLLYLGNPPHDISIREVNDLWLASADNIGVKLRQVIDGGRLRVLVDRIQDLLPNLSPESDAVVWPSIGAALFRTSDWVKGPESQRDVAEDLDGAIRLLASKGEAGRSRAKSIVSHLIQSGDMTITPSLMRAHVHKFGLAHWSKGRPQPEFSVVYSEEEFAPILIGEASRYRNSIESGQFLRRVTDADALFFLSNLELFDVSIRSSLTEQLIQPEAIGTFAALIVPPGYMSDRESFERLIDCATIERRLEGWEAADDFSQLSEWVRGSITRFNSILKGEDPH